MLGDILRELRQERSLSQQELADQLKIARGTYAHYEINKRDPDSNTLQMLADHFRVSVDFLLGRTDERRNADLIKRLSQTAPVIRIPLLGTIRAGVPVMAEENWDGEVEIPADWRADFALHVAGDSMSWAGIHEGDVAVLRQAAEAQNGQIVAAGVEDVTWSATLKYFIRDNGQTVLRAANPDYDDIPITRKHRIIGHVVGVLKDAPSYQEYRALLTSKVAADRAWENAIEVAAQHGLDGERVAQMIRLFAQVSKSV